MKPSWDGCNCYYSKCDSQAISHGLCDKHYRRLKKYGWGDGFFKSPHGRARTPEHRVWCHIKGRCLNENDKSYIHYGGRGIGICEEWRNSFDSFLRDMGERPSHKHQIDRIDNSKGYSKENCRWVTSRVNNRNRRSTKLNELQVKEIQESDMKGLDIAKIYGISVSQVCRVKNRKMWKSCEQENPNV